MIRLIVFLSLVEFVGKRRQFLNPELEEAKNVVGDSLEVSCSRLDEALARPLVVPSDKPFFACLLALGGFYAGLIMLLLLADVAYTDRESLLASLSSREIRYSIILSLVSCSISAVLSLWVSVPIGYLMSRFSFRGKSFLDAVLEVPIVLPPIVIGVSLLILFNFPPFSWTSSMVVFEIPAVIIAQFTMAAAFAIRTMRVVFDQIPIRFEEMAMTLGCSRGQAFWEVVLPQAGRGVLAAGSLAWARSLGEFGPILVFAGATRLRTEVLSTSVYLELQAGNLKGMLAVSLIMVVVAAVVLVLARFLGRRCCAYD